MVIKNIQEQQELLNNSIKEIFPHNFYTYISGIEKESNVIDFKIVIGGCEDFIFTVHHTFNGCVINFLYGNEYVLLEKDKFYKQYFRNMFEHSMKEIDFDEYNLEELDIIDGKIHKLFRDESI